MPKKSSSAVPSRSDLGNAELFAAVFRDRLRFDHARQRWLVYRKHWWEVDLDGEVVRKAKEAVRYRLSNSALESDDDKRQKEVRWALESESRTRLESMMALARSERLLADSGNDWDSNGWLLGAANGLVDLRTGVLRQGSPDDRITLHTSVAFDPQAQCSRWERFVAEIFDNDSELASYVQRAVGYSLTAQTLEQVFFCCHGEGANGKSTFLSAIAYVLGSYACNLPFSAFELAARSTIPNDVATLPGRRFVTAIETDESARLNEGRIKALTGCDLITARSLYKEFFTFKPVGKFWLAFNHRPVVADASHGFWRRVHLIPFARQFNPQAEPNLEGTLRAEAPGILAWAIQGCLDWQERGLAVPARVQAATQAYRDGSDPLREFLADRCILHVNARVSAADLWHAYSGWTLQNAESNPLGRAEFTRRLETVGLRKERVGHARVWTWFGITLLEHATAQHIVGTEPPAPSHADVRADADVQLQ
jgi:putative DNA primase/helicase